MIPLDPNATPAPTPTSNTTLFGLPLVVKFESGREVPVTMRQFKVREFPQLFGLLSQESRLIEVSINAVQGSLTDDRDPIAPDSYDELAVRLREVNRSFFGYCTRQMSLVNQMPDKVVNRAMDRAESASLNSLPR